MIKNCIQCNKEMSTGDKAYYTLDSKLLSNPCCSMECANSFKSETISKLEKIINIIKEEKISER